MDENKRVLKNKSVLLKLQIKGAKAPFICNIHSPCNFCLLANYLSGILDKSNNLLVDSAPQNLFLRFLYLFSFLKISP